MRNRTCILKILIRVACFVAIISLIYILTPSLIERFFLPIEGIRPAQYDVIKESSVAFKTTDNVELRADIYHPKGLQKTPTILVRIPLYNTYKNQFISDIIARYWASRGYTVVIQGTRGSYKSGGKFYPLSHERDDGIETLRWLAKQPWYDGRLAMWGGSAFGHTQWSIADQKNPGPSALFIQIGSSNFHSMFYPGGAFSLESALNWAMRSRNGKDAPVDMNVLDRTARQLPLIESVTMYVGYTDFFNDWLLNEHKDAYWQQIDGSNRAAHTQAPVLLMGGWFDPFLPGQIEDFKTIVESQNEAANRETRLIIGPWKHADAVKLPPKGETIPYRYESLAPSLPWFDYQLGMTREPLNMPRVKIFVMGINRWRYEDEWPLARTKYTAFYLQSKGHANTLRGDGSLKTEIDNKTKPYDQYSYDPLDPVPTAGGAMLSERAGIFQQNEVEKREDVLVYSTDPLSEATEITGPIRVILFVETNVPSTDFTAKLVDVYPDGSAYNLSDGIQRQRYIFLEGMTKSIPVKIEIDLWPTSNVFLKDHRIRLEISSSNFPRYDRNLNTGKFIPTETKSIIANQMMLKYINFERFRGDQ